MACRGGPTDRPMACSNESTSSRVVIRVRRQAPGEVDAPAIEQRTAGQDGDEHGRAKARFTLCA
jgi:hypothetical protein